MVMEQNNINKSTNAIKSQPKFEQYIISCMLNDHNVIDDALSKLSTNDFFDIKLRCIFQVIGEIHRQSKPVNKDTVIEYLSKNQELASLIGDYNSIVVNLAYE